MKNVIENMEEILNCNVSGFHQYVLDNTVHLNYVSKNFCDMTGYSEDELLSETEDKYASIVFPADQERYFEFIDKVSCKETKHSLEYRIRKKDGNICYVNDTITTKLQKDGTLVGYSVLTDITDLKKENHNLHYLNEMMPCGFVKYTCEKQPRITYINDQMIKMLRFPENPDGEVDYLALYKENIYLMIPMEEQRRFSLYLERVYRQGGPVAGEITLLRCDGTKVYCFGWVTKCVNEDGVEEFQSACMDITERHHLKKDRETKRYLKALTDVYDYIFEYDLSRSTIKCLHGQMSSPFQWVENISMQMEDATEKWITSTVFEKDQDRIRSFFQDFYKRKFEDSDTQPQQIRYRAFLSNGRMCTYMGIFLKIDTNISLFCCRSMPDIDEAELLREENTSLKNINENMQELVLKFTDGIAAFEVEDNMVTPLYASDNVCEFFGVGKDEWMSMMKKSTPIKTFIARSKTTYEEILKLLQNGEAEFTYYDLSIEKERRIKAICSQKYPDNSSTRYVMLYNIGENDKRYVNYNQPIVNIRTFGYFDVFVDGKPIAFRNEKSKELFALLVDRRGGFVSSEEAISFLWENETVNSVTLARYRKVALRLKNILEEYGISNIVESVNGKRRIVTENVTCDLFNYLSGKKEYAQLFKGNYLTNYSWGETTLAELLEII